MEIEYTKDETLKLIEEYYKRLEGREVKAHINVSKGSVGFYETLECITTITITETIDILGMKKEVKEKISEEDLNTKLKALFNLFDLNLISLSLKDGLNSKWCGYGMAEHEVQTAYFKGIIVSVVKNKNKGLTKNFG